jgi:hypothetical protein
VDVQALYLDKTIVPVLIAKMFGSGSSVLCLLPPTLPPTSPLILLSLLSLLSLPVPVLVPGVSRHETCTVDTTIVQNVKHNTFL